MAKFQTVAKAAPAPVELAPNVGEVVSLPVEVTSESNPAPEASAPVIKPAVVVVPKAPAPAPAAAPVVVVAKPKRVLSNSDKATREFYSTVKTLGEAQAKGVLSLVALALETAKAASANLIGEEDAQPIIEAFQKAKSSKLGQEAADAVSSSITQQASKLRQIIKLGLVAKKLLDNVTGDPLSSSEAEHFAEKLLERTRDRHVQVMASEQVKSLRDKTTYGTLVNIARAQLADEAKGIALTDEQIDGVVINQTEKEAKTGIDLIKLALKNALAAKDGKEVKDLPAGGFTEGRAPVVNDNLNYAIDALDCALRELDPKYDEERAKAEKAEATKKLLIEQAAQFGMTIKFNKAK